MRIGKDDPNIDLASRCARYQSGLGVLRLLVLTGKGIKLVSNAMWWVCAPLGFFQLRICSVEDQRVRPPFPRMQPSVGPPPSLLHHVPRRAVAATMQRQRPPTRSVGCFVKHECAREHERAAGQESAAVPTRAALGHGRAAPRAKRSFV